MVGKIYIVLIDLKNNGVIKVNAANDELRLGTWAFEVEISGNGTFEVSAGLINFDVVTFGAAPFIGEIKVQGSGTMKFSLRDVIIAPAGMKFIVSGGTLRIETNVVSAGGSLTWTGGTISVASAKNIQWTRTSP